MPVKRIFYVTVQVDGEPFSVPVCQLLFPNGYTLFKLYQQKAIWVMNFNDTWEVSAINKAEYQTLLAIIKLFSHRQVPGYMHLV